LRKINQWQILTKQEIKKEGNLGKINYENKKTAAPFCSKWIGLLKQVRLGGEENLTETDLAMAL